MNFKDALYETLDNTLPARPDGKENVVNAQEARILAIMWNMLAVSKNVLDDIVYIDQNTNIISKPLQKSSTKQTAKKKSKTEEIVEDKNGKEPSSEQTTTETT